MAKMWAGRTAGQVNEAADRLNASFPFDQRMMKEDIRGSMAHAAMLASQGIISESDSIQIIDGLGDILHEYETGSLTPDENAEDVHMFVEAELTRRIGDAGKRLHTARSRNDQVALDFRMYLKNECVEIGALIKELIFTVCDKAQEEKATVLPGYTHMQRAQPITFGHHLMAYANMFCRDKERLSDCMKRMNVSPIGSCALAGTTYPIDRHGEAEMLGFDSVCSNSLDGVSDRDFALELLSVLSVLSMHLSRFCEELVLWSGWEFRFVELSDDFTTGSSIMPQKKNPDMAELIRGKTGRVYGDMMTLFTVLKGLPLAYNKDLQEDKECVFDAVDTVKLCLPVMNGMVKGMKVNREEMRSAAEKGFINATDLADYLVGKGMPFRDAYKLTGALVADCIKRGIVLETVTLEEYRALSDLIGEDVFDAINLDNCVKKRTSYGGTSPESVEKQIEQMRAKQ